MRALNAVELLTVWEQGRSQPPAERALTVLIRACEGSPAEELAGLPIGRRDARLLDARESMFGSRLTGLADCPACAEVLELGFAVGDVRVPAIEAAATAGPLAIDCDGVRVSFRLPNSDDLCALAAVNTAAAARWLFERCVLGAWNSKGLPLAAAELSEDVTARVAASMAEADPQADVEIECRCPSCAQEWIAPFDIGTYLWIELNACAQRLLREVHEIASAYGWHEDEILRLSAVRRQAYLELVRQ